MPKTFLQVVPSPLQTLQRSYFTLDSRILSQPTDYNKKKKIDPGYIVFHLLRFQMAGLWSHTYRATHRDVFLPWEDKGKTCSDLYSIDKCIRDNTRPRLPTEKLHYNLRPSEKNRKISLPHSQSFSQP